MHSRLNAFKLLVKSFAENSIKYRNFVKIKGYRLSES